ncbi:response regulator [Nonomuraea sp. NPDC049400]|uniref:response regulator n=1 Tax=Nonomuraea sp. NPDC049400 TaxID=3364352 RepID=UPI0037B3B4CB
MTIRVYVVDDQDLVRTGTGMVIQAQDDMTVVGEARDGAEAVAGLRAAQTDVVLMDVRMPRMDGVAATRALLDGQERGSQGRDAHEIDGQRIDHDQPVPKVVVLTTFDLDEYAFAALRAGASGFLLKDAPATDLLAAIRTVYRGDAVIAPSTTRRLLDHVAPTLPAPDSTPDPLTNREREVLMARGETNAEIAEL